LPRYPPAAAGLAECALERALWLSRVGPRPTLVARQGLARSASALALEPRDPHLHVLEARLHLVSSDAAAARASLDRAYAVQPLVKGSRQARAAEAELAR